MNEQIYQGLKGLGKMPEQDFENSSPTMEKLANQYRGLLEMIDVITIDEAKEGIRSLGAGHKKVVRKVPEFHEKLAPELGRDRPHL